VNLLVKMNRHTGAKFLGCPNWPECSHTQPVPQTWIMRALGQPELFDLEERDG